MKFLTSTTYYLCWDVVIVAHVPWVLFVELPLSESYISCVCMVPSWTLVSVVCAECCLSGSYLSGVCMAPSWGVVIVGTRQRGVHWVLFVRVTFVRELCQGVTFVFAWCHRGVLSSWYVVFTSSPSVDYYRDVTFVRELCQGVSFMFASCHRGYSS